jgi:hypothetical protein
MSMSGDLICIKDYLGTSAMMYFVLSQQKIEYSVIGSGSKIFSVQGGFIKIQMKSVWKSH